MKPIAILNVQRQSVLRAGVETILAETSDITVAGQGATIADALQQVKGVPDLMLLDPDAVPDAAEIASPQVPAWPDLPVLLFYAEYSASLSNWCDAGLVHGCISGASTPAELLAAIRLVAGGWRCWDATSMRGLAPRQSRRLRSPAQLEVLPARGQYGYPPNRPSFTPRQIEILRLVCAGFSSRDIAARLDISVHTVFAHLANMRATFGVHNRIALLQAAQRHGLVETPGPWDAPGDTSLSLQNLPTESSPTPAGHSRGDPIGGGGLARIVDRP